MISAAEATSRIGVPAIADLDPPGDSEVGPVGQILTGAAVTELSDERRWNSDGQPAGDAVPGGAGLAEVSPAPAVASDSPAGERAGDGPRRRSVSREEDIDVTEGGGHAVR